MSDAKGSANDTLFEAPPMGEQERMVEAILFASAEPVSVKELNDRLPPGCDAAEALVHLQKRYEGRGVHVAHRGGMGHSHGRRFGFFDAKRNGRTA